MFRADLEGCNQNEVNRADLEGCNQNELKTDQSLGAFGWSKAKVTGETEGNRKTDGVAVAKEE